MARPIQDTERTLEIRRVLDASRERVFRAWTDLEQLRRWWGPGGFTLPNAEQDLRVGGRFRFSMRAPSGIIHVLSGEYREIQPPERLTFTWNWEGEGANDVTLVTVQLHAQGSQTELVLTHGVFSDPDAMMRHSHGWNSQLDRIPGVL